MYYCLTFGFLILDNERLNMWAIKLLVWILLNIAGDLTIGAIVGLLPSLTVASVDMHLVFSAIGWIAFGKESWDFLNKLGNNFGK